MINGYFVLYGCVVMVDDMYEYPFDEVKAMLHTNSSICQRD